MYQSVGASCDSWLKVYKNPYQHTIPDAEFYGLIEDVADARTKDILLRHAAGEYSRDSMAFVVLDPTASPRVSNEEAILFVVSIGPEGDDFVANAIAKVFEQRDMEVDCGVLVYTQNHRLADGCFRYGFSVNIDGTIVGGSGETELEDRYQCTLLGADFNLRVGRTRKAWEEFVGKGRWYCNQNEPGEVYQKVVLRVMGNYHTIVPIGTTNEVELDDGRESCASPGTSE